MEVHVFSSKPYDRKYINAALQVSSHEITAVHHTQPLDTETPLPSRPLPVVCIFVNDHLPSELIRTLHADHGTRLILLRCAGYNNIDLPTCHSLSIQVTNVPSYSPEAVAEFAVALTMSLNRKTHRAYNRVREGNFALDGLMGRTLHGKTVGVVGTGKIGAAFARIMKGFGCRILAYDLYPSEALAELCEYQSLEEVLKESDIVSLHCPLTPETNHLINADTLRLLKKDAMLINTSRGALIDTPALIAALKSRSIGAVGLDVYEDEAGLFYKDHSADFIDDDVLMRLMSFPNVLIAGHQAFFTQEALTEIAETTIKSVEEFVEGKDCRYSLVRNLKGKPEILPVREP